MIDSLQKLDQTLLLMFNGSNSMIIDGMMVTLTSAYVWIPMYLVLYYIVIKNNEKMSQILLVTFCVALGFLLSDGLSDGLAKPFFKRWRPCYDPVIGSLVNVVGTPMESDYGFFSAHAANTSAQAVFLSLVFRSRWFTLLMAVWSLLCCYTRVYLGLHYPGDILCGLLCGSLCGLIAYAVYVYAYRRISVKINYISSKYTSTGYSLQDIDLVYFVFALTLVASLIRGLLFQ